VASNVALLGTPIRAGRRPQSVLVWWLAGGTPRGIRAIRAIRRSLVQASDASPSQGATSHCSRSCIHQLPKKRSHVHVSRHDLRHLASGVGPRSNEARMPRQTSLAIGG
jgi:hypothetical protein